MSCRVLSLSKDEDTTIYLGNLFCVHPHTKESCWGFFLMLEQDLLCSSLCPVSGKSLDSSFQPYQVFVHVDVYNLLFSGLDDPTSPSLSSCDGCSDP